MRKLLIPGLVACSLAFEVGVAYFWDDNVESVPQSSPDEGVYIVVTNDHVVHSAAPPLSLHLL